MSLKGFIRKYIGSPFHKIGNKEAGINILIQKWNDDAIALRCESFLKGIYDACDSDPALRNIRKYHNRTVFTKKRLVPVEEIPELKVIASPIIYGLEELPILYNSFFILKPKMMPLITYNRLAQNSDYRKFLECKIKEFRNDLPKGFDVIMTGDITRTTFVVHVFTTQEIFDE